MPEVISEQLPFTLPLFLGIDGGGTKCKGRIEDAKGLLLAEALEGSANIARDFQASIINIERLIARLFASVLALQKNERLDENSYQDRIIALKKNTHVCLGLAGYHAPQAKRALLQWKATHGDKQFAHLLLTSDIHIACLGAHLDATGGVIVLGTGSSALGLNGAKEYSFGGYGFVLGDDASGAFIGRKLIQFALKAIDGMCDKSELLESTLEQFAPQPKAQIMEQYLTAAPADFAKFAAQVFAAKDRGDWVANVIIDEALDYVSKLMNRLAQCDIKKISLIGGLAPLYTKALYAAEQTSSTVTSTNIDSQAHKTNVLHLLTPAKASPEEGAIFCLQQRIRGH